ncbi:MAG: cbb3-type cytochrome c oxidase N-terminal domain-containing protein [Candidatus Marithrix sp.]
MNNKLIMSAVMLAVVIFGIVYAVADQYIGDDTINILSMIAAGIIVGLTAMVMVQYLNQIKNDRATGELAEENWDGIGEYKNELPFGWAISFLLTTVFAIWYFLSGYPLNAFSQIGQYNEEVNMHNAKFETTFSNADEETLNEMGESIFLVQCAPCHGVSGDGIEARAADFTKWGAEEGIVNSVLHGSKGLGYAMGEMPSGLLDEQSAKAVSSYIMAEISTYGKTKNPDLVATGKELYSACAACHGDDGKGMYGTSPDLTKYGTSTFVADVLQSGKKGFIGAMPTYKVEDGVMTPIQQRAVGTFISHLSK